MRVLALLASCLLTSCATAIPDALQTEVLAGCVVVPDGVKVGTVQSALATVRVSEGCFEIPVEVGAPTLAVASTAQGDPLAMGWISSDAPDLSARTTAESLLWFAVGGPTVGLEGGAALREALSGDERVEPVATAVTAALDADPRAFRALVPAVDAAITKSVQAMLEVQGSDVANATLVNPSSEQSGVSITTNDGFNQITLVNGFRRAAHAFVKRVSYVDADGVEQPSAADIVDLPVESVKGVTGGLAGVSDILAATQEPGGLSSSENVGYVPRGFGPVDLPNVEGAKRTTYEVVVGPGASKGVIDDQPDAVRKRQLLTSAEFLVGDFVLPLMLQVGLPAIKADALGGEVGKAVTTDMAWLISSQIPDALDEVANGDPMGALATTMEAIGRSSTLRLALFDVIFEKLYDFSTPGLAAGSDRALAAAQGFARVTGALDAFFALGDGTILVNSVLSSDQAVRFEVDVTDAVVRWNPREAKVGTESSVTLEVNVIDAGEDAVFEYRYSTGGSSGTLRSDITEGHEITSSRDTITYVSGEEEGTDTITVEVYEVVLSERVYAGEAKASVEVTDDCEAQDPQRATYELIEVQYPCFDMDRQRCSKAYFTYTFRAVEGVWAYTADIEMEGEGTLGFRPGERTLQRYYRTSQPQYVYHDADTLDGWAITQVRTVGDGELIYIPRTNTQLDTHLEANQGYFEAGVASQRGYYDNTTVWITPQCPDP